MHKAYLAFTIIAFGATLIFSFQNRETISVSFLTASVEIPKVAVIGCSYLLGMITGWGLFGMMKHALRNSRGGLKRKSDSSE